jgi:hypothetical protein
MWTNFLSRYHRICDSRRLEGWIVAERATDLAEELLAVAGTGREWSGLGSVNETHKHGEHDPRRHDLQWVVVKLGLSAWNVKGFVDNTTVRVFCGPWEEVVADAHFDVVSLTGKMVIAFCAFQTMIVPLFGTMLTLGGAEILVGARMAEMDTSIAEAE